MTPEETMREYGVDDWSAEALLQAASAALLRGRSDEARRLARYARGLLRASEQPATMAADIARLEAQASLSEGDADAALDCLATARAIAELSGDESGAARSINGMAIVHFRRGQLDEAERLLESALQRARWANARRLIASATLNLGGVALVRGELPRARDLFAACLADFRALDLPIDEAQAFNNLGLVHVKLGEWEQAERAYAAAAALCERTGDLDALSRLHVNVAEMWVGRGDLERAEEACARALATCERTDHGATRGEIEKMRGIVARERGLAEEAEARFVDASRLAALRDDLLLQAEVLREQAELYHRVARNRDTLQALNRAHRLFERLRARRELADIDQRLGALEGEFVVVAQRWGESIEAQDRYTQGHCQRVADLACLVAERAGLDAQSLFWFRIGALLHDVGKLSIPAEVLNKPGKLTDEEWQLIRGHPAAGVEMLRDVEFPWDITPIVRSHHERWDGRGYPDGLRGESIPLVARILCVADVYDALTSVRSYKRRLSHDETLELLRKDSGTAFDPQVFAWFEDVAPAWAARAVAHPSEPPEEEIEREAAATRLALGLDALTGLQPRVPFAAACAHVLAARATDGRPVSVIRLALRLHDAVAVPGDALLRMAAEVISRNTSGGALVGRWSTADFTVLLPDVAGPDALAVGARLAEAVALQRGAGSMGTEVAGALRTAWAVASAPVDGTTPEALLEVLEGRTEDALRADDRGTPVGARPSHG